MEEDQTDTNEEEVDWQDENLARQGTKIPKYHTTKIPNVKA